MCGVWFLYMCKDILTVATCLSTLTTHSIVLFLTSLFSLSKYNIYIYILPYIYLLIVNFTYFFKVKDHTNVYKCLFSRGSFFLEGYEDVDPHLHLVR